MDTDTDVAVKLRLAGTQRAAPLEATMARASKVGRRIGVTRVADLTGLDHVGIPVAVAVRPLALSLSVTQGKGHSRLAAFVSGLMECIEFFHAEFVTKPVRFETYRSIRRTEPVLDPDLIVQPANSRFTSDIRIPWVEARSIRDGTPTWVPLELIDLDMTLPHSYLHGCFHGSSNGLASGNTRDEATVHALCEAIERDVVYRSHRQTSDDRDARRLDLSSVTAPLSADLIERFERAGVGLAAWDLTDELGVPTFNAVATDFEARGFRRVPPAAGFGTHLDPDIALSRAITEAAQSRITTIAGTRDDITRERYLTHNDSDNREKVTELMSAPTPYRFGGLVDRSQDSFDDDIVTLCAASAQDPLVVDLTRPEFGLPVVRVIVPGFNDLRAAPPSQGDAA